MKRKRFSEIWYIGLFIDDPIGMLVLLLLFVVLWVTGLHDDPED